MYCKCAFRFFELFFTADVWDLLVTNTNNYAVIGEDQPASGRPWEPVTVQDIKAFFGVILLMGIMQLPRIEDYWQESSFHLRSNISHVFPLIRFFHSCTIGCDSMTYGILF